MNIVLTGKHALVGGSSKGIGSAIAQQLAASGASVTIMARNTSKLEAVLESLDTSKGQEHHFLEVDFTAFEEYKNLLSDYLKNNPIDILVNNTQGPAAGNAINLSVGDYQNAFDVLFKCVVWTTQTALENMQKKQWGRIINVSSVTVKTPFNYLALSNTIRSAVVTWAKTLSLEVASQGITVNNVLTGFFDTERLMEICQENAKAQNTSIEKVREGIADKIPMKRLGIPKEYGQLVTYLASPQASYITGTSIPIDGGFLPIT